MHGIDFMTALSRLLSNASLRHRHRQDPIQAAGLLSIRAEDRDALIALDPDQLDAQAHTLLTKRLGAARRMVPELFDENAEETANQFLAYAETFWPTGHNRHHEDALNFCSYLSRQEGNKAEHNRLRFQAGQRRFAVHFVSAVVIRGQVRRAVQILCRFPVRTREFRLYLSV